MMSKILNVSKLCLVIYNIINLWYMIDHNWQQWKIEQSQLGVFDMLQNINL